MGRKPFKFKIYWSQYELHSCISLVSLFYVVIYAVDENCYRGLGFSKINSFVILNNHKYRASFPPTNLKDPIDFISHIFTLLLRGDTFEIFIKLLQVNKTQRNQITSSRHLTVWYFTNKMKKQNLADWISSYAY